MTKKLIVLALAGAVTLMTACTCTESDCTSKYNLMKKDESACLAAFPTLQKSISPTPGPKIIIRKVSGDFAWYTDTGSGEVLQPGGAAIWGTSYNFRKDFCGAIMDFTVDDTSSTAHSNSSLVVLQSQVGGQTYTIEIWRTAQDKIKWIISKGSDRHSLNCVDGAYPTTVPAEFVGAVVVFRESLADVDLNDVNFLRTAN